ncbi:TRAM domain-containing protein, partial [Acidobacteriota bacterium]
VLASDFTGGPDVKYSPRPKTSAAKDIDSIPLAVKKQRLIELQALQKKIQTEINQISVGKTELTLCLAKSRKGSRMFTGRNEGYQVINFDADKNVLGRFIDVDITSSGPYSLRGNASAHSLVSL